MSRIYNVLEQIILKLSHTTKSVNGVAADADRNIELKPFDIGALSTAGGQMTGSINMSQKKITNLPTPTASGDAVSKIYADTTFEKKHLRFKNLTIGATSFYMDSTYEDYPYRSSIPLEGVQAEMIPEVVFAVADAVGGNYAPVSECYQGGVYIYAASIPENAITIPTIICESEVA